MLLGRPGRFRQPIGRLFTWLTHKLGHTKLVNIYTHWFKLHTWLRYLHSDLPRTRVKRCALTKSWKKQIGGSKKWNIWRNRQFQDKWRELKSGKMVCTSCPSWPPLADKTGLFYVGTETFRIQNIHSHDLSVRHQMCMAANEVCHNVSLRSNVCISGTMDKNYCTVSPHNAVNFKYVVLYAIAPIVSELNLL